ncbi:MAG TPA: 2-dehydropantoate 2-reductase, partial [Solirubrobacteraceae bacterium]|nr:2-dehydropantoate 2-reductase [Solirubrobacteraceae bacterium]
TLVAREGSASRLAVDGLRIRSVRLGDFLVHPPVTTALTADPDVLVVAVKAPQLAAALERIAPGVRPGVVVPLLNGLEHLAPLRARFGHEAVVAGSTTIAAERVSPGLILHTSPLSRIELGPETPAASAFSHQLRMAEIPARLRPTEADVLWRKLAGLAPLSLVTAASGLPAGPVVQHPRWRLLLQDAVDQCVAVAAAEGVRLDADALLAKQAELPPDAISSLARDVEAGGPNELDAIGGAVLRAAARHRLACPAVEQLVELVADRVR